jgi:DNA-binding CsgD family transcriptional regulator
MAERRPTVLISLADRVRAEELAAYLAEQEGMLTLLREEVQGDRLAEAGLNAMVTDDISAVGAIPTILLGDTAPASLESNIRAMLPLSAHGSLIAAAVRLAEAGYRVVPEREQPVSSSRRHVTDHVPISIQLTQREREVLALLAEGASNKLIARRLDISVHTAKFHVAAILQKLGAVNRTDAIAIAMREGLVLI